MTKHRVAFYLPALHGGGAERVVLTMAAAIRDRGHDVELVLDRAGGDLYGEAAQAFRTSLLNAPRTLLAAPRLARWIASRRPDVLVASLTHANAVAIAARAMSSHGCALIAWEHNLFSGLSAVNDWRQDLGRFLAKLTLPRADLVLAVSEAVASDLRTSIPLRADQVRVVFNPIPMPRPEELAEATPHPWLARGEPPVIVSAGRLIAHKDYKTLLGAFARVPKPARLIILGEGECRPDLEALVDQLGLRDRVLMPGFKANPRAWISRARVFALSSLQEGFGNVIVEALGCGVQVVSTRSGGPPVEILDHGKFGRLVDCSDEPALAQAIMDAMQAPLDTDLLKARARDFRPDHIGGIFETALDDAIAVNRSRSGKLAAQADAAR